MTPENDYPTVTDLDPPSLMQGEYKDVKQIVGERILVQAIDDWRGKVRYLKQAGRTLLVSGLMEDKTEIWFFMSQDVLYHKFDWLRDKTPFVATIFVPEGVRYYDVK